jgi:GNAT superfamily N-acetyltransferase
MPAQNSVTVSPLSESELPAANRLMRLAFGTFLGLPDPMAFMGDRDFLTPRFHASNTRLYGAREGDRLIGVNAATRWGAFAFFGPLVVLPEFWNKGIAQLLLEPTVKLFDRWDVRSSGLFTFAHSAKHVGLYQKFGYWPGSLTALMTRTPEPSSSAHPPAVFSSLPRTQHKQMLGACARLTDRIDRGLDLTGEIRSVLAQKTGDVVLLSAGAGLDGFALCLHGPGSEGGMKTCYIKFAAARSGPAFDRLLEGCDAFAAARGLSIEAGVNLARKDAFQRMRAHGYRSMTQGIAMLRPHVAGTHRDGVYVMDDWR